MSHRFDPRPGLLSVLVLTSVGALAVASCAKVDTAGPGSGGATGSSGGNSGTGSMTGTGNTTGSGGGTPSRNDGGLITADMNVGVCQEGNYKYVPQIPTVYVMVDRSGSMFDCLSTTNVEASCTNMADTPWTKLKEGVLTVVKALQAEVRFGFASFTGTNPRLGGMCPMIDREPPKLDNHDAIKARYDGLAFGPNTTESGKKFETPASQSLRLIGADLMADTTEGAKYILYVTDGEPDYCGDGNSLCPPDGVVGALQKLKAGGITTIVFGIKSAIAQDLPVGVLEAFANAGAGEPTMAPLRGTNPRIQDIYDQCYNTGAPADEAPGGWTREFVATGKPLMSGQTIGDYMATAGPTKPYRPDVSNQTMLINQLSQALSGVKSCTFNLNNLDGKMLKIDATQLDKVSVSVQGTAVPLDMTNGWKLNGTSELELAGTACANWRMPMNNDIKIQIPCAVIIVE